MEESRSGRRGVRDLQFSFLNFHFSISLILLPLLILFVFVSSALAQKKSSCIECHIKLDDPRVDFARLMTIGDENLAVRRNQHGTGHI